MAAGDADIYLRQSGLGSVLVARFGPSLATTRTGWAALCR